MKRKIRHELTPREARTFDQICSLRRDGASYGDYWIQLEEMVVTLVEQKIGERPRSITALPRHVFEKFIRWYDTGSTRRPK